MNYQEKYKLWLESDFFDQATKEELKSLTEEEIKDRFYQDLTFGTAGLRGILGAGSNRMNAYMIQQVSQALADTIREEGQEMMDRGVVIGHDVRHGSQEFSKITAEVLAANGIKVYYSQGICPTPFVSYAIRELKAASGVMVTASHNPKNYNGYKVYWSEGSQILDGVAGRIEENIKKHSDFQGIKKITFEAGRSSGLIEEISAELWEKYYNLVLGLAIEEEQVDKKIKIVYTPLNGVGNLPVREVLKRRGFEEIHVVEEQELPDPDFTTVNYPNPENPKAFEYAEALGQKVGADLLLATDPDCDRVAVEVKNSQGQYEFINGNRLGALLVYYILSRRFEKKDLPTNGVIVKSIVTGDLSKVIARSFGIGCVETLTGFKNISGIANVFDQTKEHSWIFGFEESIGFNYGNFVRDKDGVSTSMMVAEMAGYYKKQGLTLLDVLERIYQDYGYYKEKLFSLRLEGRAGQETINKIMASFREESFDKVLGYSLQERIDFLEEDDFLRTNALKFYYEGNNWFALRPSGTEPLIKAYLYANAEKEEEAEALLKEMEERIRERMDHFVKE